MGVFCFISFWTHIRLAPMVWEGLWRCPGTSLRQHITKPYLGKFWDLREQRCEARDGASHRGAMWRPDFGVVVRWIKLLTLPFLSKEVMLSAPLEFYPGCCHITSRTLLQARSQAEHFCTFKDKPFPRCVRKEQGLKLGFLECRLEYWYQRTRITSNLPVWLRTLLALFLSYRQLNNIPGRLSMKVY